MNIFEKIKFYTAFISAKFIEKALQICKKQATSLPGMVATKIDNSFLHNISGYSKKEIITVTGTNGKTTTSGILAAILKSSGASVVHNQKGANMPQGIASALASGVSLFKKSDYFVLENDEAYLSKIYDDIKADYLVVTNLFRDQLDRYGELETTARKIRTAIDKNPNLKVVLNADDPMLHSLYTKNTLTYGFEDINMVDINPETHSAKENVYCQCSLPLNYTKSFYAHIGHYYCSCGYSRKVPDVAASAKVYKDKAELTVKYDGKSYTFIVNIPGLYNVYNALAAIAMGLLLKISPDKIQNALDRFQSVFGRAERIEVKGKPVFIQLIKNPVGASEVIRTISNNNKSGLLIAINDEYADGRDVSWLWDTDFEALASYENTIYVSGKRAYDMALRLKYAGFNENNIKVIQDVKAAVIGALESLPENQTLNILPTYTALLYMQEFLKKL